MKKSAPAATQPAADSTRNPERFASHYDYPIVGGGAAGGPTLGPTRRRFMRQALASAAGLLLLPGASITERLTRHYPERLRAILT